jgi:hypothetical protein
MIGRGIVWKGREGKETNRRGGNDPESRKEP